MKIPDIVIKEYLKGKTIYSFGDSLIYGLSTGEGILDGLCTKYEMNYNKYGVNGGSIIQRTNKIITQVENASDIQPDFVVFDGMINDTELTDTQIGTISSVKDDSQDKTTFCGAYEHLCYTLQHKYSNAYIIYVTPHRMPIRALAAKERLHNLVLQMCEKWNIPVVDIYTISDIDTNIEWMRISYSVDADNVRPGNGLHLTGEGYDLYYAPFILNEILNTMQMTISQQLITLNEAKQDIKAAIIEKGQTVADNMHEYAEAIDNISGGTVDNTDYLCFEALEDNEISCGYYGTWSVPYPELEYSFDKQTWTQWGDYTSTSISMQTGQKLYLRGNNPNGFCESDTSYMAFTTASKVNLSGNIMSIIDKQCLSTTLTNRGALKALFRYVIAVDASLLSLPATSLSPFCYQFLFRYSTELINGPKVLPAITLEEGCYSYLFQGATKIKEAPYLPAKTLVTNCYVGMFNGCSNIQYVKADFTTTPGIDYSNDWLYGVPSTGCFIKANDASWTTKSTSACPTGWTLITSVV